MFPNGFSVPRIILLPPAAGEGGDGGRAQVACGQPLHPHPGPPPSQREGSLCANLMGSDLVGLVPHRHGSVRGGQGAVSGLPLLCVVPQEEGFARSILFIGEMPAVERQDAQRHCVPDVSFQKLNAQIDLGTKLLVQLLKESIT